MTKNYIAKEIEVPQAVYEKLDGMGSTLSFTEAVTNDGKLHDKAAFAIAVGLFVPVTSMFELSARQNNHKRVELSDFAEIMAGVGVSYLLGDMTWDLTSGAGPILIPEVPTPEELSQHETLTTRNGKVYETDEIIGHLIGHTTDEELSDMYNMIYPKTGPIRAKEPKNTAVIYGLVAYLKAIDTHIAGEGRVTK